MTSLNVQLVSAIFANDSDLIKSLLDQGMDVNDNGIFTIPPLLRAALYGKSKALKTLIECGADKAIKDKQGHTAIELARKHNHQKIIDILLQN